MLSNLLSDSFTKTNKHIVQHDTRNHFGTNFIYCHLSHTGLGWFRMFQLRPMVKACRTEGISDKWKYNMSQNIYTVKSLCSYLSVSRATLYRLIGNGEIEPLHIGSCIRFTETEVNRYISRQQKQARSNEVGF